MHFNKKLLLLVGVAVAVPLTLGLAVTQQTIRQNASETTAMIPSPSSAQIPTPPPPVTSPQPNASNQLSCSDCASAGKDGICFNVEQNRAYCRNINESENVNTICRKCAPQTTKTPKCVTPPACVYGNPRCMIAVPVGGWCPGGTPTPVCLGTDCPYYPTPTPHL